IITLVAFVIQFQSASEKKEAVRESLKEKVVELTNNKSIRQELLDDIQQELRKQGIDVEIDQNLGVLRLTEKAVHFRRNKAVLDEIPRQNLETISEVLARLLPCYANQAIAIKLDCDEKTIGKLEAVFIEGHTDNVPVKGREDFNWQLSTRRAIATYQYMIISQPILAQLNNNNTPPQSLFSVAGYAEQRPVVAYDRPTDDARNRRIDMRFIMTPPSETPEIIQAIHDNGVR
ncbi:MAG: OmpA family protein, partial [Taibaiella sp.]|nr:OmpA family protein [Taibaiella sp.]